MNFRPGEDIRLGRNYSSKLHEFSLQARNCGSGEKPLELSQECVHRVKEGEKKRSWNLEKQEEKHRSDGIRAGAYGFSSDLPLLSCNGCHG